MSILLSRLCANTEKTYNMKLVAGQNGLENPVRWVHMVEDVDAAGFIHGNELVFTTGIRQQGLEWIFGFVVSLRESGAAGLVLNIGPYITSVPPQVIVYCEKNNFPLFTMPWEEHIIDVTYDFCHRIVRNEELETGVATAFRNLIFSPENREGYQSTMLRSGFHNESSYTAAAISIASETETRAAELWKKYQFDFGRILRRSRYSVCIFLQENSLIVIRQNSPPEEMRELILSLEKLLSAGEKIHAGISRSAEGWLSVPALYNEAVSALTVARQRGKTAEEYSNIGVYKILFGVKDRAVLNDYVKTALGPLIEWDARSGTDYTETLRRYLENEGSVQATAAAMNVHRNTINYKMKMIRDILGNDLKDSDRMNCLLAFCIMNMNK